MLSGTRKKWKLQNLPEEISNKYNVPTRNNNNDKLRITKGPPKVRWTDKDSMAWRAFHYFLIGTVIYWFGLPLWVNFIGISGTYLQLIGESYNWFAMTMSAIILGYMGFTTLPFLGSRRRVITNPREEGQDDLYAEDQSNDVEGGDTIVVDKKQFMKAVEDKQKQTPQDDDTDDNEIK